MKYEVFTMIIKLNELFGGIKNEILIDEIISFDENYISNTDIKKLENLKVKGKVFKDSSDELNLKVNISGNMLIEDSITLEEVYYPFSIEIEENIEENLENDENTIDILEILWQNIVLEIPLKYTTIKDLSEIKGDGWKLVDEDFKKEVDNPFIELKEKMEEE